MGKIKSISAIIIAGSILFVGCGYSSVPTRKAIETTASVTSGERINSILSEKPSQITVLVDGTLVDQENGRDEFEAK